MKSLDGGGKSTGGPASVGLWRTWKPARGQGVNKGMGAFYVPAQMSQQPVLLIVICWCILIHDGDTSGAQRALTTVVAMQTWAGPNFEFEGVPKRGNRVVDNVTECD
jgi:hypothetical protein